MSDMGFVAAGYLLTWAVLIGYGWRIMKRIRDATRALGGDPGTLAGEDK
ncbi:MAG: hypothetical protein V3U67_00785 [Gemmatimonadota bacterium]